MAHALLKISNKMELRSHPLMSYRGAPNWPPIWTWIGGEKNKRPKGEVGTLKEVLVSVVEPYNRFFLIVEYDQATYIGCLLFDDEPFCMETCRYVKDHCNHTIEEIGGLEVSYSL